MSALTILNLLIGGAAIMAWAYLLLHDDGEEPDNTFF